MNYKSKMFRTLAFGAFAMGLLVTGVVTANAQRDPFAKPSYQRERKTFIPGTKAPGSGAAVNYGPPPIEARIEYFKRIREQAAANGQPLPKVTSVLTLGEMSVTGIFKTPRGWAAMVEATPIKLSYTIYPGEKFFDGQLVAVEENKLVFRKVTKTGAGKFVASVENKSLRQFTMKEEVQGTATADRTQVARTESAPAPADPSAATPSTKPSKQTKQPANANPFLSPLDEMNSQDGKPTPEKEKTKKGKKPVKVAKNNGSENQ